MVFVFSPYIYILENAVPTFTFKLFKLLMILYIALSGQVLVKAKDSTQNFRVNPFTT